MARAVGLSPGMLLCVAVALTAGGCGTLGGGQRMAVRGDSLVLTGTNPGNLCFDGLTPGTVCVRSTYEPGAKGAIAYERCRDYVVDCKNGTIARTADSRIPDFSTNILYGRKEFDHNDFPGFGNAGFFAFVDYETRRPYPLCADGDQSALLPKTVAKLKAGGPFKIVSYGDSITAGIDASAQHLMFQYRYAAYLSERYPAAEIEVENTATSGDSTVQGLARLEEKVLTRSPDLVLLGFGMNDHNVNSVTPDQFEQNLVTIVDTIRERTGAEVIVYSTFPPNPDWKFGSHRMEVYAEATKRAARKAQCAYADVNSVFMTVLKRKDLPSLLGNNINHPNDFGHWLYFEALRNVEF